MDDGKQPQCSNLLFAPHTTEGFSMQIKSFFIGVAFALQCNRTLVLTPQFSLTYNYIKWASLTDSATEHVRDAGISYFVDMPHLQSLLAPRHLRVISFSKARPCLSQLQSCTYLDDIGEPKASDPLGDIDLGVMYHWQWAVQRALLMYDFNPRCEMYDTTSHRVSNYSWERLFVHKAQTCFAHHERDLEWIDATKLDGRAASGANSKICQSTKALCITGGTWSVQRLLGPDSRLLNQRLLLLHHHPAHYQVAAQHALAEHHINDANLIVVHWRRGDVWLNNHPEQRGWTLQILVAFAVDGYHKLKGLRNNGSVEPPALYVMTDVPIDAQQVDMLHGKLIPPISAQQLLTRSYVGGIDDMLIEQEIALHATLFVGHKASSVSQWVVDKRRMEDKPFLYAYEAFHADAPEINASRGSEESG
jgi:hypothetical protein